MAVDPVCKMNVDEKKAMITSEYQGKKYYFCAVGCKKEFEKNPEKYLSGGEPQAEGECGTGWESR